MAIRMTGADHRQLVGVFANTREVVRDQQTALPSRAKLAKVWREIANLAPSRIDVFLVWRQLLARMLSQLRLVIEGIDLAGSAIHREEDATLGLGREMRGP